MLKSGGQAVLGRQDLVTTPWHTERHGYDPTLIDLLPIDNDANYLGTMSHSLIQQCQGQLLFGN